MAEERQAHHQPFLPASAASTSGPAQPPQQSPLAAPSASAAAPSRLRAEWDRVRLVRRLWLGVGAQLARDVPFSALYWSMVEPIRRGLLAVSEDPVRRPRACLLCFQYNDGR